MTTAPCPAGAHWCAPGSPRVRRRRRRRRRRRGARRPRTAAGGRDSRRHPAPRPRAPSLSPQAPPPPSLPPHPLPAAERSRRGRMERRNRRGGGAAAVTAAAAAAHARARTDAEGDERCLPHDLSRPHPAPTPPPPPPSSFTAHLARTQCTAAEHAVVQNASTWFGWWCVCVRSCDGTQSGSDPRWRHGKNIWRSISVAVDHIRPQTARTFFFSRKDAFG